MGLKKAAGVGETTRRREERVALESGAGRGEDRGGRWTGEGRAAGKEPAE